MYNHNGCVVNFFGLSVDRLEILSYLRKNLHLKEVCKNIYYKNIIYQAAQERSLIVTPEEIQTEINYLRLEKYLETDDDIIVWLTEQMLTVEDWEEAIRDRLLEQKLSESLFSQEVEIFFIQNQRNFDQVLLYQLVVPYEHLAHELFYQISEQEISFYEAAHLYDIDEKRRDKCGYVGKTYRYNFNPELAVIVFNAGVGELIGPVRTQDGIHLLTVEEFIPSELTTTIRQNILNQMFMQWLENQLDNLLQSNDSI
ncbi:peptidylprolyl isomerase [Tolypothrix campylonemoides VB511288]|nr:peptidylprolyl isomerase [Tolypothrix campylonemoides VB511288]